MLFVQTHSGTIGSFNGRQSSGKLQQNRDCPLYYLIKGSSVRWSVHGF